MLSNIQNNFFKDQVCSNEDKAVINFKYLLGLTKFLRWINSFPENNIHFLGENERIFSDYLSSLISLSKDSTTLYLGIQRREAEWIKYFPFYAACIDIDNAYIGLLCKKLIINRKEIPAINIAIKIDEDWRINQLSQLRRLCFIGVKVSCGKVVQVYDKSSEVLNLYHQSLTRTAQEYAFSKAKESDIISKII